MATVSVLPSRKLVYVDLIVTDKSGSANPSKNTSVVEWKVVIRRGTVSWDTSWSGWGQKIYATIDITGLGSRTIYIPRYNYDGKVPPGTVLDSGSFSITHNANGTKSIDFGISFTDKANGNKSGKYYTPGNGSRVGSSLNLQVVPRYSTSNQSLSSKTETSITMNWSSDNTCDYIWYSKDNGANWTAVGSVNSTSGSYTISGLTANTNYNIKTRVRRKDSQLTTDSGNLSVTTYDYPKINSTPNFIIGNTLTIGLYNPLGRSCKVYLINAGNTSESSGNTTTGTSISGYTSTTYTDLLYAGIPTSKTGTYKVRLVCSAVSRDTTITGGTYSIKNNGTENPTFDSSYIIDVVDTLNTAITGDNTKFIKGHNTLTGKIKPMVTKNSATPDYYSISATGQTTQTKNYSSSNISFSFNNVTSNQIKVNAVDERTLSTEATKNITIVDYNNPTLTDINITRQNGIGDHIYLNLQGRYTNWTGLSQSNAIQRFRYRYKSQASGSSWSSWITITGYTSTNGTWTINKLLDTTFNNTTKYDMEVEVQDKVETVVFTGLVVSTANAFIWKDLANKRLGIGKKPTQTLDVNGNINSSNNINGKIVTATDYGEFPNGIRGKTIGGGQGTSGYFYVFDVTTTDQYQNQFISFDVLQRNRIGHVDLQFKSSGTKGTMEISTIRKQGNIDVYYTNSNNVFSLYIKKSESYDTMEIINLEKGSYMKNTIITWKNITVSSLPSGYVTVTMNSLINDIYPVGSIYMSYKSTSPATLFGGTWEQLKNHFLFATNATSGDKGGSGNGTGTSSGSTKLTAAQSGLPSHQHALQNANPGGTTVGWTNYGVDAISNKGYTGNVKTGLTGGLSASEGHTHTIPYIEVYVWRRTA